MGPTVWTTLSLTLRADGSSEWELAGASAFPRHWVYDHTGRLVAKSGLTDFKEWYRTAFGAHRPWGDEDSPVLTTTAGDGARATTAAAVMRKGARPGLRRLRQGATLVEHGEPGEELYLLLDGVLEVEVDGAKVAEVGPGAVAGERALLEGGRRTATLRAVTDCRIAVADRDRLDPVALEELAAGHRRED